MAGLADLPRGAGPGDAGDGATQPGGWQGLAPGWLVLPGASLAGLPADSRPAERRLALLHPLRGVVILDLLPPLTPPVDAAEAVVTEARLCERLRVAGFPNIFSGHLPLLHLGLPEAELPGLARRLDAEFARLPPLSLPTGDAWMGTVRRALTTQPIALPEPFSSPSKRHQARRRGQRIAMRLAGSAACVAGLGLVVAVFAAGTPGGRAPLRAAEAVIRLDDVPLVSSAQAAVQGDGDAAPDAMIGAEADPSPDPAAEPIEPLPEPDEARLPDLAAEPATAAAPDAPVPEPDAARLPDLTAEPATAAAPDAPVPEPDAARLPDLAAEPATAAAPDAPVPEPDAARLRDLAAEPATAAAPDAPVPEPDEARLPDLAAEPATAAAPVPPVPTSDEARLPEPATEPSPVAAPVAPDRSATAAVAPRAATLAPAVIEMLVTRGNAMLARGDVSAARLLFRRAADAGSAEAATALGRTFDPAVLTAIGARGIRPDPDQAAQWYRRGAELGATR